MAELRVRADVLTGKEAVEVGAEGEGMVLGDIVNTASRLQSVAASCCSDVLEPFGGRAQARSNGPARRRRRSAISPDVASRLTRRANTQASAAATDPGSRVLIHPWRTRR